MTTLVRKSYSLGTFSAISDCCKFSLKRKDLALHSHSTDANKTKRIYLLCRTFIDRKDLALAQRLCGTNVFFIFDCIWNDPRCILAAKPLVINNILFYALLFIVVFSACVNFNLSAAICFSEQSHFCHFHVSLLIPSHNCMPC